MSLSLPGSVSMPPVAPDRDATIGLTMAATVATVAVVAAIAIRATEVIASHVAEAIGTISVDGLLTVVAVVVSLALAVGAGALVARDAEWVRPTPGGPGSR